MKPKPDNLFIGVDPGLHGAAVLIDGRGKLLSIQDTPTLLVKTGRRNRHVYLETNMIAILESFRDAGTIQCVGIENQHSRPGQGAPATFSQGYGLGLWIMALAALRLPYTRIEPVVWKRKMGIVAKSDKNASIVRALQLFPHASLQRVKDHDRAEALLIAEYVRRANGPAAGNQQ